MIAALDRDSRTPLSALARQLRLGRDLVEYRLDRLMRQGVIRGFTVSVDPFRLGKSVFRVSVRLKGSRSEELLKTLRSHPDIHWVAECHGRWDVMYGVFANDTAHFIEVQEKILRKFKDRIVELTPTLLLTRRRYPRKYLSADKVVETELRPGDGVIAVDSFEELLIKELSSNGRAGYVELARSLKSTPAIVKYRVERLEESKVITGYRVRLDLSRIAMMQYRLAIEVTGFDPKLDQKIAEFCRNHPNVRVLLTQIGNLPIEIEAEVAHQDELYALIDELRDRFPELIRIEPLLVREITCQRIYYEEA